MTDNEKINGVVDEDKKSLENKISRQIEYYFGDHNLTRDEFLKEKIKEENGWIHLDVLLKFNRLKNLSTDKKFIIKAVKESSNQLIEVDEKSEKIRRSVDKPLPDLSDDELKLDKEARSVYSKGFPLETTLDEIIEFFDAFGIVENIFMKRFLNVKKFKGSVYTLFKKIEDADRFLSQDEISFKDVVLFKESSKQHREAKELKKTNKIKKKLAQAAKQTQNEEEIKYGCLLHLSSIHKSISREDIKEVFNDLSKITWIYFSRGDTEGWIRFEENDGAKIAFDKIKKSHEDCVRIKNKSVKIRILEGEEEIEYWNKMREIKKEEELKLKEKKVKVGTSKSRARHRQCRWLSRKHKREESAKGEKESGSKKTKTDFQNVDKNSKSENSKVELKCDNNKKQKK